MRYVLRGCADLHGRFITNGEILADHSNAAKLHREGLEQGLINAAEVEGWNRNTHGVLPKDINDGPRMGDWWDNYQRTQSARDDQDDSGYEGDLSDAKPPAARYGMCEPPLRMDQLDVDDKWGDGEPVCTVTRVGSAAREPQATYDEPNWVDFPPYEPDVSDPPF